MLSKTRTSSLIFLLLSEFVILHGITEPFLNVGCEVYHSTSLLGIHLGVWSDHGVRKRTTGTLLEIMVVCRQLLKTNLVKISSCATSQTDVMQSNKKRCRAVGSTARKLRKRTTHVLSFGFQKDVITVGGELEVRRAQISLC